MGTRKAGKSLRFFGRGIYFPLCSVLLVFSALLTVQSASAADCASLAKLSLKDTAIASAAVFPAAGPVPEYCKVLGSIKNLPQSTIEFEVALPTSKWNGKYFFAGGGGFNGTIPKLDQALAEGYAAAGSDSGHKGDSLDAQWALNNLQAQVNYAYLATHVTVQIGKEIVRSFYGQPQRRSYFVGCSNGGKMALAEVQRYPDDFDAAIAGDPVIDRTKLMMSYTYNARALARGPIPPSKIPVIEKATLAACRDGGGEFGDLITTPGRCKFDPRTIQCASGDGANCLTAEQAQALDKIWHGPVNSSGTQLYPGFTVGHEDDYASFITGNGTSSASPSSTWKFQEGFMRYFIFRPTFDPVEQFNFDKDLAKLESFSQDQDAANPDLSIFKAHGGKLILYHGWADHSITPVRTIEYYASVIDMMGNPRPDPGAENAGAVTDFARLFMVPGMHHCGGGPGTASFGAANQGFPTQYDPEHDIVMALDHWVESGVAPDKIIASHLTNKVADRTLPLCPYPQTQVYSGSGDVKDAQNYRCESHDFWWSLENFPGINALKQVASILK
ncbi:MAG TPA: tannase/feruloyl esterase family alpha/beta hydrolase [Candidatus Acidoferrales bacterium]|nr:tannase/feruloyl esterase family alpha/beta hydrolase [Candidatus Acidoferrales bacterium]